jgi:uncharacterized protein
MRLVLHVLAREVALESWPIPHELVLAGKSEASGRVLRRTENERRAIAVYRCTPGRFTWTPETDETITCLGARATVSIADGEPLELSPGVACHDLATGMVTEWDVRETLLDAVVLSQRRWSRSDV